MRSLLFVLSTFAILAAAMYFVARPQEHLDRPRNWTRLEPNPYAETLPPPAYKRQVVTKPPPAATRAALPEIDIESLLATWAERLDEWAVHTRTTLRRHIPTQLSVAATWMKAARYDQAIAVFDRILERDDEHPEALSGKALALWKSGRRRASIQAYEGLLAIWPNDLEARFGYAVALASVGQNGRAIEAYRFILTRRPDHGRALFNLASLMQDEGKLSDALLAWRKATDLNPALTPAWFQRGTVALELERFDEARNAFANVVAQNPQDAIARGNLGVALLGLGRRDEAIRQFEQTIVMKADLVPVLCAWAEALAETKLDETEYESSRQKARELAERVLAIESRNPRARAVLARVP